VRNKYTVLLILVFAVVVAGYLATISEAGVTPRYSIYREEVAVTTYFPGFNQETATIKSWVKDEKMRSETADGTDVTIVRSDLDVIYMINMKRLVYSETPLAVYHRAGRLSMAMLAADLAYQWTGRKKKIGAWMCREVILAEQTGQAGERMKTIWWVTKDTLLDVRLLRHFMSITFGSQSDELSTRFYDKLENIDGYPVQTESEVTRGNQSMRKVQTLRKLERREIPDSMFDLPSGLTRITAPLPPGLGG